MILLEAIYTLDSLRKNIGWERDEGKEDHTLFPPQTKREGSRIEAGLVN